MLAEAADSNSREIPVSLYQGHCLTCKMKSLGKMLKSTVAVSLAVMAVKVPRANQTIELLAAQVA